MKEIDEPVEPVNPNWPPKETVDKPSKINEKKRARKKEKFQETSKSQSSCFSDRSSKRHCILCGWVVVFLCILWVNLYVSM